MKRMTIFENNRSYVTDQSIHEMINKMERIVRHVEPYDMIQQLPELYHTFDDKFLELLEAECKPIKEAVKRDYDVVRGELEKDDQLKDLFSSTFRARFFELEKRLDEANNLYVAAGIETESDRLKIRCMEEIQQELNRRAAEQAKKTEKNDETESGCGGAIVKPVVVQRKTKTLSKNTIIRGTRSLKSEADIDVFLEELRKTLLDEMDENTTINLV